MRLSIRWYKSRITISEIIDDCSTMNQLKLKIFTVNHVEVVNLLLWAEHTYWNRNFYGHDSYCYSIPIHYVELF